MQIHMLPILKCGLCLTGSATNLTAGVAEKARKAHVSLPSRGRGSRGRGTRATPRTGTGSAMKLGASKLGKTGDEFFDF